MLRPQFLPEDEYYGLTDALLGGETAWEDVKALAMLAASSFSTV
jgi:hypothetical protein